MRNTTKRNIKTIVLALTVAAGLNLDTAAAQGIMDRIKQQADRARAAQQQRQRQQQQGTPQPGQRQPAPPQAASAPGQPADSPSQPAASGPASNEECCTKEATARIAAAAGFVDIVGIKPGMSVKDAMVALKAHNPNMKLEPWSEKLALFPNLDFLMRVHATAYSNSPGGSETIDMSFTVPPTEEVVWGVERSVTFLPAERPTAVNTLASLRQKYGPESGNNDSPTRRQYNVAPDIYYWVFDPRGKLAPEKEATEFFLSCEAANALSTTGSDNSFLSAGSGNPWMGSSSRLPKPVNCGTNTLVKVQILYSEPAGPGPKGLVNLLKVRVANGLLHRSGYEVTYTMVRQASKNQENQELEKARKQGGPTL